MTEINIPLAKKSWIISGSRFNLSSPVPEHFEGLATGRGDVGSFVAAA